MLLKLVVQAVHTVCRPAPQRYSWQHDNIGSGLAGVAPLRTAHFSTIARWQSFTSRKDHLLRLSFLSKVCKWLNKCMTLCGFVRLLCLWYMCVWWNQPYLFSADLNGPVKHGTFNCCFYEGSPVWSWNNNTTASSPQQTEACYLVERYVVPCYCNIIAYMSVMRQHNHLCIWGWCYPPLGCVTRVMLLRPWSQWFGAFHTQQHF